MGNAMETPSTYYVLLKSLPAGNNSVNYVLDNDFFISVGNDDIRKGNVNVEVKIRKVTNIYEMEIHLAGNVNIICDRCLEEMQQLIDYDDKLFVKFADVETTEETDNGTIVLPDRENGIDIKWYLYEFTALSIPFKHVHAEGQCNELMRKEFNKYIVNSDETDEAKAKIETENKQTDPRWDVLKELYNK